MRDYPYLRAFQRLYMGCDENRAEDRAYVERRLDEARRLGAPERAVYYAHEDGWVLVDDLPDPAARARVIEIAEEPR